MSDYFLATSSSLAANSNNTRWLTEEVFKLIDMVQRDEAIYNPRHKYYFCRPYVENFWRDVDLKLEKNSGASLAKWTNLRISFRREYTNYLEEKVPPCWSYFDRMFFLHPYLRKKHQQPKSLDSQVQDALVQISSLSNRIQLQRERAAAAATLNANNSNSTEPGQQLDNYLDYFDEPDQNNSELDEMIDDEPQARFQNLETHSLNNDIKSECEENVDDYETDARNDDDEVDDVEMRNFVLSSLTSNSANATANALEKRQNLRLQHLNRLQTRSYHEDLRAKRPRSQENISSTQTTSSSHTQRIVCSSTPVHSNVSLVRPTISKPIVDMVSTTSNNNVNTSDSEITSAVPQAHVANSLQSIQTSHGHQRNHHLHHHHRLEISGISTNTNTTTAATNVNATVGVASTSAANAALPAAHVELCDCKTDPDAMFLMSLLPDIQKLNGRDRGKIKIAFQNILQDYLYPD